MSFLERLRFGAPQACQAGRDRLYPVFALVAEFESKKRIVCRGSGL